MHGQTVFTWNFIEMDSNMHVRTLITLLIPITVIPIII